MDFVWDVLLRTAAMGVGIALYSGLLAYDPWERHCGPSGNGGEGPREG